MFPTPLCVHVFRGIVAMTFCSAPCELAVPCTNALFVEKVISSLNGIKMGDKTIVVQRANAGVAAGGKVFIVMLWVGRNPRKPSPNPHVRQLHATPRGDTRPQNSVLCVCAKGRKVAL